MLVVAKNDRKLRIEVGYGLEGALTDVTARRIIDEIITPKFRSGDFAGGISAGVDRIIRVVDGEPLPAPPPRPQQRHRQVPTSQTSSIRSIRSPSSPFCCSAGVMRSLLGRLFGSVATGGLVGVVVWFIFGSLIVSRHRRPRSPRLSRCSATAFTATGLRAAGGGWSGGSYSGGGGGWSGGGSSSDSGGFSGGGGSFGGGGASGSW